MKEILDEYCWMHDGEGNGGWMCRECHKEASYQRTAVKSMIVVGLFELISMLLIYGIAAFTHVSSTYSTIGYWTVSLIAMAALLFFNREVIWRRTK